MTVDDVDRGLLAALQEDAGQSYAALHQVDGVTSTQTVVVLETFFGKQPTVV